MSLTVCRAAVQPHKVLERAPATARRHLRGRLHREAIRPPSRCKLRQPRIRAIPRQVTLLNRPALPRSTS
jgi:hypothetical protein